MANYSGHTTHYGLQYPVDGDFLSGSVEKVRAETIENLLRAGILAAGSTRVYKEGTYTATLNDDSSVTVTLTGQPAIQGVLSLGLVEVFTPLVWASLEVGASYFLYVRANPNLYQNAADVTLIASQTQVDRSDHLFLATLDNTTEGAPALDTNPTGKPIGNNLYDFLNSTVNPFGSGVTQRNILLTEAPRVELSPTAAFRIIQASAEATQPALTIENSSAQPEVYSPGELRFKDSRTSLVGGIPLSDAVNTDLPSGATSILGALAGLQLKGIVEKFSPLDIIRCDISEWDDATGYVRGDLVVGSDLNHYECITNHTSAVGVDEPITDDPDWRDNWVRVGPRIIPQIDEMGRPFVPLSGTGLPRFILEGIVGSNYTGGSLKLVIYYAMETAIADNVQFNVEAEPLQVGTLVATGDFGTASNNVQTVPGVVKTLQKIEIAVNLTLEAAEGFRIRVERDNSILDPAVGVLRFYRATLVEF
jgi:hypothetical protein